MAKLVIRHPIGDANNLYTGFTDHVAYSRMKNEKIVWSVGRYALVVHFDMDVQAQVATNAEHSDT